MTKPQLLQGTTIMTDKQQLVVGTNWSHTTIACCLCGSELKEPGLRILQMVGKAFEDYRYVCDKCAKKHDPDVLAECLLLRRWDAAKRLRNDVQAFPDLEANRQDWLRSEEAGAWEAIQTAIEDESVIVPEDYVCPCPYAPWARQEKYEPTYAHRHRAYCDELHRKEKERQRRLERTSDEAFREEAVLISVQHNPGDTYLVFGVPRDPMTDRLSFLRSVSIAVVAHDGEGMPLMDIEQAVDGSMQTLVDAAEKIWSSTAAST